MPRLPRPRQIARAVVIVAMTAGAAAHVPAVGAPQGPRTAMIVGQIVDGTTGAPVPEAVVRLTMPPQGMPDLRVAPDLPAVGGRVMADAEGRFFFSELPAGQFWLEATKDGYASGTYRQRRPSQSGERLPLHEGERRVDVTLRVWKYAVIGGTVVDEAGEPVVGVAVRALVRRIVAGRPQYGTESSYLVPSGITDDRGMFRLAKVEPGTYVVVVPSTQTTLPVSVMAGMDSYALRVELSRAGVRTEPPASPQGPPLPNHRVLRIGDAALLTMNSVLIPPPSSPGARLEVYRTTYFPAATTAAESTEITIGTGEERTGLAIRLRPSPAVRIAGRLVAPDGSAPPPMTIRLAGEALRDVATRSLPSSPAEVGLETATAVSDAGGRFTLLGVPPGQYVLTQANPFLVAAAREGLPAYWFAQRITVGESDQTDLVVDLRHALRVEGRLEFRGANGPQRLPPGFGATTVVFETASGEPGQVAASANRETLEFATVAAGGQYVVRAGGSAGWFVQSVTLDGQAITDRAFDLQADATSIVITFTDRPSKVSGTVKDASGNASSTAVVLIFPVDREQWTNHGRTSPMRSAFANDGVYTFAHVPAGEYYAIAIDDPGTDDWRDPQTLAALATRATRVTVAAGDAARTLDLAVRAIR
jgi:hypothetical protein